MALEKAEDELASRRLFLVRHGESTWNAVGLVQGQADVPQLTPLGIRQARQGARGLAGARVGALYSSDLKRATATARAFSQELGLPVATDVRLRERAFGVAEGTPRVLLRADRSGVEGGLVVDADAAPEGGESIRELYHRAAAFVMDLLDQPAPGDTVAVCHGGVVRVVTALLDGVGPDSMPWAPIGNGAVLCRALRLPALAT